MALGRCCNLSLILTIIFIVFSYNEHLSILDVLTIFKLFSAKFFSSVQFIKIVQSIILVNVHTLYSTLVHLVV